MVQTSGWDRKQRVELWQLRCRCGGRNEDTSQERGCPWYSWSEELEPPTSGGDDGHTAFRVL